MYIFNFYKCKIQFLAVLLFYKLIADLIVAETDLVTHGPGRVDEPPVGGAGDAVIGPPLVPVPLHRGQTQQQRRQGGRGQGHRDDEVEGKINKSQSQVCSH